MHLGDRAVDTRLQLFEFLQPLLDIGIKRTAIDDVTSPTTGPARNTQVVVVEKTEPF